ncbi:acyl-CoA N-acyltransferase [Whalleya microplaca]|nr:acyl-CoA N-acyltransferase [Whalleya microplaca]
MPTATQRPDAPIIRIIAASETYPLRHAVLWPHKSVDYVKLPDDESGQHFGAFITTAPSTNEATEELVSIISLFIDEHGEARFRKFATASPWQGQGVGSALLTYTIEAAAKAGAKSIWCDARQSALGFYQRFGMEAEGEVFFKGEVPYLRMSRTLS